METELMQDHGYSLTRGSTQAAAESRYSPFASKSITSKKKQQTIECYFKIVRISSNQIKKTNILETFTLGYSSMIKMLNRLRQKLHFETLFDILPHFEAFPIKNQTQYPCTKKTCTKTNFFSSQQLENPNYWVNAVNNQRKPIVVWCRPQKQSKQMVDKCVEAFEKRKNRGFIVITTKTTTTAVLKKSKAMTKVKTFETKYQTVWISYFDFFS